MKGITYCGACADYDFKKHRCKRGAMQESNPQDKFFDDCPLPTVAPVRHGAWIEREDMLFDTYYSCSACGEDFYIEQIGDPVKDLFTYTYCPNCGARMDEGAKNGKTDV